MAGDLDLTRCPNAKEARIEVEKITPSKRDSTSPARSKLRSPVLEDGSVTCSTAKPLAVMRNATKSVVSIPEPSQ